MRILLTIIILTSTLVDAIISGERVKQLGLKGELNPFLRKFYLLFGLRRGLILGLILPNIFTTILLYFWPMGLSFFAGMKFCFANLQLLAYFLNPSGKV